MNAIGIDWGSSSLRAYLFDGSHALLDYRESDQGITRLNAERQHFEQTLLELIADWRQPDMLILLSGMITSRNGWIETPYLPCPARSTDLFDHAVSMELADLRLKFLPGVCQSGSDAQVAPMPGLMPDVMRGEELQLLGTGPKAGTELLVLPGTHSKWALVNSDAVIAFRNIPTGELFDVLVSRSLIGGLAQSSEWSDSHFIDGVECGYHQDAILGQLFTCRSSVLLETRSPSESRSWLSGLLIGREVREGSALQSVTIDMLRLVGSEKLCALYKAALEHLEVHCEIEARDAAQLGYQCLLARTG